MLYIDTLRSMSNIVNNIKILSVKSKKESKEEQ